MLSADLRNVRTARQHLRDALALAGLDDLTDRAALAVTEVVTNAFVHTGTPVQLRITTGAAMVRVEVEDGGMQHPIRRSYADTAGTGRGLQLLAESVDRWGTTGIQGGKFVWFELGDVDPLMTDPADTGRIDVGTPVVRVTLRQVPLLMHVAWQEHAASLLREYLLFALSDDEDALDKHAQASAAMSLLHEQLPAPTLGSEPTALMADAVEPHVTAQEIVVDIPVSAVPYFDVLNMLLRSAIVQARAGALLSPPTQPEIDEMRQWLCTEVARQGAGDRTATPWVARTDVRSAVLDPAEPPGQHARYAEFAGAEGAVLVSDEASVIVVVSAEALGLLGYGTADELLGRRVLVVVPSQFHQAHIAGTTMNATNGRDNLLAIPIRVPMVRADASEVLVDLEVRPHLLNDGRRVFVARFAIADAQTSARESAAR
ncbi:ATP-binding protein [Nocardioides zhouii]|nr:ATP-binding protein [Nocardioides zhouii]